MVSTLRVIFDSYFEATTIHGFAYIHSSKPVLVKIIWTLVVIVGFSVAGTMVTNLLLDWDSNQTITTLDSIAVPVTEAQFPTVTVCPDETAQPDNWALPELVLNTVPFLPILDDGEDQGQALQDFRRLALSLVNQLKVGVWNHQIQNPKESGYQLHQWDVPLGTFLSQFMDHLKNDDLLPQDYTEEDQILKKVLLQASRMLGIQANISLFDIPLIMAVPVKTELQGLDEDQSMLTSSSFVHSPDNDSHDKICSIAWRNFVEGNGNADDWWHPCDVPKSREELLCCHYWTSRLGHNLMVIMKIMRMAQRRGNPALNVTRTLQDFDKDGNSFRYPFNTLSEDDNDHVKFDPTSFIGYCHYKGANYSHTKELKNRCNLFKPIATDRGICHSFNAGKLSKVMRESNFTEVVKEVYHDELQGQDQVHMGTGIGDTFALEFIVDNNAIFRPQSSQNPYGFHISIGSRNDVALFRPNQRKLEPGYTLRYTVHPTEVEASENLRDIDIEDRGCRLAHETDGIMEIFKEYSQADCQFECMLKMARKKCQCTPWNMPTIPGQPLTICDIYGNYCFDNIMSQLDLMEGCNCEIDCNIVKFTVTEERLRIEDARQYCQTLPTGSYLVEAKQTVYRNPVPAFIEMSQEIGRDQLCDHMFKENIAVISVNFGINTYTRTVMTPRMTFGDKLGSFGGTLGLFTGMSIISMFEIAFWLFKELAGCCKSALASLRKPADKSEETKTEKKDKPPAIKVPDAKPAWTPVHKDCTRGDFAIGLIVTLSLLAIAGLTVLLLIQTGAIGKDKDNDKAPTPDTDIVSLNACQQCLFPWTYKHQTDSAISFDDCANPDNDPSGSWCPTFLDKDRGYVIGSGLFRYCPDLGCQQAKTTPGQTDTTTDPDESITTVVPPEPEQGGQCIDQFIFNRVCDGDNNLASCAYDGWDCCNSDSTCGCVDDACICHETESIHCQEVTKFVIGYGTPSQDVYNEVIDFSNNSVACDDMGRLEYNKKLTGATGGLLLGKYPLVCGGYTGTEADQGVQKACFLIGEEDTIIVNMTEKRMAASSITLGHEDSVLWVTGGEFDKTLGVKLSTTDMVTLNESTRGPVMPEPLSNHCVAKISAYSAMVIAGDSNERRYLAKTWFYDVVSEVFTQGPNLKIGRQGHVCGVIADTFDSTLMVVAAGGYDIDIGDMVSAEAWTLELGVWQDLPDMPKALSHSPGISLPNGKSFLVIGGESGSYLSDSLLELTCFNKTCTWNEMDQKLDVARELSVAIVLPDNQANCSERIATSTVSTPSTSDPCSKRSWVGDGYCDGQTNVPECDYDGGDCCKGSDTICYYCSTNCVCHLDNVDNCA